jgi:predicted PurR-regulated permease PerM
MTPDLVILFVIVILSFVAIAILLYKLSIVTAQRDTLSNKLHEITDFLLETGSAIEKLQQGMQDHTISSLVQDKQFEESLDKCLELFKDKVKAPENLGTYNSKGQKN